MVENKYTGVGSDKDFMAAHIDQLKADAVLMGGKIDYLESRIAELEQFHNSFVSSHSTENCLDYCRGKDKEIATLEQRNRALVEALKYHQEQTRPIERTKQALKEVPN